MTVNSSFSGNLDYNQGASPGRCTFIRIFEYQRPTPQSKLLKNPLGFITLPLPDNMPSDSYSMSLNDADLGVAGAATNVDKNSGITQLQNTLNERLGMSGYAGNIAGLGALILGNTPIASDLFKEVSGVPATALATSGIVRNPHTALLFNNVHLRDFSLNWILSPRNEGQSKTLDKIIKTIKLAMHPSLQAGGFALDYPNLVTIDFKNDKEGILKVDYAFIQSLNINPTPQGQAYYKNGYPVSIGLSMHVKEVKIKTAEDFGYGYTNAGGTSTGRIGGPV